MTMLQVNESDVRPPKLKALKDLTPLAHDKMLKALAHDINKLIHEHEDFTENGFKIKLAAGKMLAEAQDIFYKKEGLTKHIGDNRTPGSPYLRAAENFKIWCEENIKSRKGIPYAHNTIKKYCSFYRNPATRHSDMANARNTLINLRDYDARRKKLTPLLSTKSTTTEKVMALTNIWDAAGSAVQDKFLQDVDHVNLLVSTWDKAPEKARRQFMKITGLKQA